MSKCSRNTLSSFITYIPMCVSSRASSALGPRGARARAGGRRRRARDVAPTGTGIRARAPQAGEAELLRAFATWSLGQPGLEGARYVGGSPRAPQLSESKCRLPTHTGKAPSLLAPAPTPATGTPQTLFARRRRPSEPYLSNRRIATVVPFPSPLRVAPTALLSHTRRRRKVCNCTAACVLSEAF